MSLPPHQQRFMRVAQHFAEHTEFLHYLSYSEESDKWRACAGKVLKPSMFTQVVPVAKGLKGWNITLEAKDEVKIAGYKPVKRIETAPDLRQLRIDDPEFQTEKA